ncbi:MAG: hypothetical protein ACREQ9_23010, partial [Candidatus Binatia bacterium]
MRFLAIDVHEGRHGSAYFQLRQIDGTMPEHFENRVIQFDCVAFSRAEDGSPQLQASGPDLTDLASRYYFLVVDRNFLDLSNEDDSVEVSPTPGPGACGAETIGWPT